MKALLLVLCFISAYGQAKFTVLTYSSMMDPGGLGEWIKSRRPEVEWLMAKDFSGILGTLHRFARQKKLGEIDFVLGLSQPHYLTALNEGLIVRGQAYEQAPFAFLANRKLLPAEKIPRTWSDLTKNFKNKIIVQDPRTSEVGLAWLLNATFSKNLTLEQAKALSSRIFPTWTDSFRAFKNGAAPLLWTYATSYFYFLCQNKPEAKDFENLDLPNLPVIANYAAATKSNKPSASNFLNFILSSTTQAEIWKKNWMQPATATHPPDCFSSFKPETYKPLQLQDSSLILKWLDAWSL